MMVQPKHKRYIVPNSTAKVSSSSSVLTSLFFAIIVCFVPLPGVVIVVIISKSQEKRER